MIKSNLTFEGLLNFPIGRISRFAKEKGYSLYDLETHYFDMLGASWIWTSKYGKTLLTAKMNIRKDGDGLYLEILCDWEGKETRTIFYLRRRESNVKKGTYRYYFLDPFSEKDPGYCSKLYFVDGYFYSRSYLQRDGVLYDLQRRGHTDRYVFGIWEKIPSPEKMKYRKTHYRGKQTPIWRKYDTIVHKGRQRLFSYYLAEGIIDGDWAERVARSLYPSKNG